MHKVPLYKKLCFTLYLIFCCYLISVFTVTFLSYFSIKQPQSESFVYKQNGHYFTRLVSLLDQDHLLGDDLAEHQRNSQIFLKEINQTLDKYIPFFKEAAKSYHLDWKLLAAIGYQESRWNPHAVSETGVKGIMMLTTETANHLGVEDRTDLVNSIHGAAKYVADLKDQLAKDVAEPERTWFALAAYNLGPTHIKAAREITRKRKGDSNTWFDVSQTLYLLKDSSYEKQPDIKRIDIKRIEQAIDYVRNVKTYYKILARLALDDEGIKQSIREQSINPYRSANLAHDPLPHHRLAMQ